MWASAHHFSTGLVVSGPSDNCCFHCLAENWHMAGDDQGSLCGPWDSEAQAHSLPYPVSPVVSILPGEQEESHLILEEVDPHWEEDEHQEGSTSTSPQTSEAAPADEEKGEVVEQTPRWEPEKALKKRLSGKITGIWYRIPICKRAESWDQTYLLLPLPPTRYTSFSPWARQLPRFFCNFPGPI